MVKMLKDILQPNLLDIKLKWLPKEQQKTWIKMNQKIYKTCIKFIKMNILKYLKRFSSHVKVLKIDYTGKQITVLQEPGKEQMMIRYYLRLIYVLIIIFQKDLVD